MLRYCARPTLRLRSGQVYAGERLAWVAPNERLIYHLPKPRPNGQTLLYLKPVEFLDRLAVLAPPPRKHRHRYHGVLAPHSPLRPAVAAYAGLPLDDPAPPATCLPGHRQMPPAQAPAAPQRASPSAYLWAVLLARIDAVVPLI